MSLSWEKSEKGFGYAITNSKSKMWNNKILYLNGRNDANQIKSNVNISKDDVSKLINVRTKGRTKIIEEIHQALLENRKPDNLGDKYLTVYETLKNKKETDSSIKLPPDTTFELLPLLPKDMKDGRYRSTLFVAGESGSGKTYLCKNYIILYNELYPKNKVFFISQQSKDNDESLKEIRGIMEQISIEDLMNEDNPITWESFENCLIFFDDYGGFSKKKVKRGGTSQYECVKDLIDNVLNNSRKFGVSVIVSSHDLFGAQQHETVLKECENFCLFPEGILFDNLMYFCNKKLGLNKDTVKEIKENRSRFVIIRRKVPMCMLTQYDAQILK